MSPVRGDPLILNAMIPCSLGIFGLCVMLQGCENGVDVGSHSTYSWAAVNSYPTYPTGPTDACDTKLSTLYYPLDTCYCIPRLCRTMSKSGANTITMTDFDVTDTTCQNPKKTGTLISGTCSSSMMVEFADDGPGAQIESFGTITCDGTSNGPSFVKLNTCYQTGRNSSSKWVCASGKVKTYSYTSGDCLSGGELIFEIATGECYADAEREINIRFKSGC